MSERPPHNPYRTEADRQRAITVRLVILAMVLAGALAELALQQWLGW